MVLWLSSRVEMIIMEMTSAHTAMKIAMMRLILSLKLSGFSFSMIYHPTVHDYFLIYTG
jgi:hypothetical protein